MRAFVISLARHPERGRKTIAAFNEAGIDLEVFDAVDGMAGFEFEDGESVNYRDEKVRPHIIVHPPQIGCYLSHYRLLRRAYEEGLERVFVVEDDVRPLPGFRQAFDEMSQLPDSFEFIRLYCPARERRIPGCVPRAPAGRVAHRLRDGRRIVRLRGLVYFLSAYIMNRSGMKKFLDCAQPICAPVDVLMAYFWHTDIASYVVPESLVKDAEEASTIMGPELFNQLEKNTGEWAAAAKEDAGIRAVLGRRLWHLRDWFAWRGYVRRRRSEFYDE